MADKKDLRGSIMKMREVAQLLSGWADDMESSLEAGKKKKAAAAADAAVSVAASVAVPAEVPVAVPAEAQVAEPVSVPEAAPAVDAGVPVTEAAAPPAADLTYEGVRGVLSAKCAAGFRAQVQAIINAFGASKFSEVASEHYPALLEMVSELGGDADAG